MKRILKAAIAIIVGATLMALMGWAYVRGSEADGNVTCRKVQVSIKGGGNESFVSPAEVREAVLRQFGSFEGRTESQIDLVKVESFVNERSAVESCEVYMTRDSVLNINIKQRQPVIRFQNEDGGCYCDSRGNLFPLQKSTSARVLVVDGKLPFSTSTFGKPESARARSWLTRMVAMSDYIGHSNWKNRVSQLCVNEKGDLVVYIKGATERFIFGTPDDVADKFDRIECYFTSVKPSMEERKYSTVNVKFDRQIVCRK